VEKIKVGNITLHVYEWTHGSGRVYFRYDYRCPTTNAKKYVTRSTLKAAKQAARDHALRMSNATLDPATLTKEQLQAFSRMLAHDPHLRLVDEFISYVKRERPKITIADSLAAFLAVKAANMAGSAQNSDTLAKHLAGFSTHCASSQIMADVTPSMCQGFIDGNGKRSARYRLNIRRSLITFFRWARKMEHLPDATTAAEKTERPIIVRSIPETYTAEQVRTILTRCLPEFVPWFALQAFAGIRGDEMAGTGSKSPLDWSDVNWRAGIIVVRPETAKTKCKRVVPINTALRAWLEPHAKESGAIAVNDPRKYNCGNSETKRLGKILGGWKQNALRHSFISYRAAQVGLGKTAMEAGNSESEAKRSYNDAMSEAEAVEYFAILPEGGII
jgi:integrase